MRKVITGAVFAVLLALGSVPPAGAQNASLEQCQALKDRIDRYTSLRRMGGSARKMESLKNRLRNAEAKFRENGCGAYRRELK